MVNLGLAIYKKEKKKEFDKIFKKQWLKSKPKISPKYQIIGHKTLKQGYVLFQISSKCFLTYTSFDNFLYGLSEELATSDIGMVIGHNDSDGYIWMDFPGNYKDG